MAIFDPVWAVDGETSVPSPDEIRIGFKCGPVTNTRMNYIIQSLEAAINSLDPGNQVPTDRLINTNTGIQGGGDLSQDRTFSLDILGLTTVSSIASGDWIPLYDVSGEVTGKITRSNLVAGLGGGGGSITGGANIGDGDGEIFSSLDGSDLEFRTIAVGGGLEVVTAGDTVTISFADITDELTDE